MKIHFPVIFWTAFSGVFSSIQLYSQSSETVSYSFTTFAGSPGITGSSDGKGNAARFNGPAGLRLDSTSNLYVADSNNNTIRKISPDAVVTTIAGRPGTAGGKDGTATDAEFNNPGGIAVDSQGTLYVADCGNNVIRTVSSKGVVTTFAGKLGELAFINQSLQCFNRGFEDGPHDVAQFYGLSDLATDSSGNLYVADMLNNAIRQVSSTGAVTTLAGKPKAGLPSRDGPSSEALFNQPEGIAMDAAGNIYVADTYNDTIRKISTKHVVTTLAGKAGVAGSVDGPCANARFNQPSDIALDGAGNVYVADSANNTIRKITPDGAVITIAGKAGQAGTADGNGDTALFNNPCSIAVDIKGQIYVGDMSNNTIRKGTLSDAINVK